MGGTNFLQGCVALTGSAARIALIPTAFGLMLGIVKSADAFKRIGIIVGTVISLLVLP